MSNAENKHPQVVGGVIIRDLITVKEAATIYPVKEATWRDWIHKRRVRHVKWGRRVFLRRTEIEAMIDAGVVPARSMEE